MARRGYDRIIMYDDSSGEPPLRSLKHWRRHGFYWARAGPFGLVVVSDLIVTRFVYDGVNPVVLDLDRRQAGVYDAIGGELFPRDHFFSYLNAMRSAYGKRPSPRLSIFGKINAFAFMHATVESGHVDPIKLQLRILRKLWSARKFVEFALDDLRNEILWHYGQGEPGDSSWVDFCDATVRARTGKDQVAQLAEIARRPQKDDSEGMDVDIVQVEMEQCSRERFEFRLSRPTENTYTL